MAYSMATAQLALQLSALAYVDENTDASQQQMIEGISAGLQTAGYADWSVAWGPALDQDRSNMMYAAANTAGDQVAVSVRGTDWDFWLDWVEDFDNFLPLTSYSSFGVMVGPNVKIAQGTGDGLGILLALNDGTNDLRSFITTKAQTAKILVTGHSLRRMSGRGAGAVHCRVARWRCQYERLHLCRAIPRQRRVRRLLQRLVSGGAARDAEYGVPFLQQPRRRPQWLGQSIDGRDLLPAAAAVPIGYQRRYQLRDR